MKLTLEQTKIKECGLDASSLAIVQEYGDVEQSKKQSMIKQGWKENPSKWDPSEVGPLDALSMPGLGKPGKPSKPGKPAELEGKETDL